MSKSIRYTLFLLFFLPFAAMAQIEVATEGVGTGAPAKPVIPARLKTGKPQLFCSQGNCGYVLNDSFLIPLQYMELEPEYSDFMVARLHSKKYGVINKQGETVLPFDYLVMKRVAAGTLLVGIKGQGYGLLNPQGKVLIPLEYQYEQHYIDSVMVFHSPGKQKIIKLIDADQVQVIMEGTFEEIEKGPDNRPFFFVKENGRWGVMHYNKRLLVPCLYDKIHHIEENQVIAEKDGKWGVVNLQGKVLVPFEYRRINPRLRNGYYVNGKSPLPGQWRWGMVDSLGQTILPNEYQTVSLSNNCDMFEILKGGKTGLVDATGKMRIPLQFGEIYEAKHPEYKVETSKDGATKSVYQDGYGLYFKTQDTASVKLGLWHVDKGEILKPLYESVEVLQVNGPYAATQNGKKALFSSEAKQLTGFEYNFLNVDRYRPNLVKAALPDRKHQLLRLSDGQPVEAEFYDEILQIGNTDGLYFITKKDRLAALHQPDGRRITPHKYSTIHYCIEPVTIDGLPKGRIIVACAYLSNDTGAFFWAIDDAGAEYIYKPK
ncbi:MAG: WG repeat-containing protein [Saprospiraceae bacterium]|nr:WG repeat-containing protein [Saprospiraceae bacterium]